MKPKVFLSHSAVDKPFIHKVANDLRSAYIEVWIDEWEIPVGESIRKKIFEEGILYCDLFFVYLTKTSIESYWVKKELDSAVIIKADKKHPFLSLFVESDELRKSLSADLRALNIPTFNEEKYLSPLIKLISKVWQITTMKQELSLNEKTRIISLEKENEILKLQAEVQQLKIVGNRNADSVIDRMQNTIIEINGRKIQMMEIFNDIKYLLASGTSDGGIRNKIDKKFGINRKITTNELDYYSLVSITGFFVIENIVIVKEETDNMVKMYYITEFGSEIARR